MITKTKYCSKITIFETGEIVTWNTQNPALDHEKILGMMKLYGNIMKILVIELTFDGIGAIHPQLLLLGKKIKGRWCYYHYKKGWLSFSKYPPILTDCNVQLYSGIYFKIIN